MSSPCKSIYNTPKPSKHSKRVYCTPRSRRKNIRTVADIPISAQKGNNNKNNNDKTSICTICLERMDISDIASLNSCSHKYHRDCILSWSCIENACPLCKTKFNTIIDIRNNNNKIEINNKKQEASYHIELGNIIYLDCICTYCGSDDNEHLLLLCDGCDDAAHTYCIGLGDNVPYGDYFCQICKPSEKKQSENTNLNQIDSDEEYKPSPTPKRQRRKKYKKKYKKKNKKRSQTHRTRNENISDEEYIPENNINLYTNRDRQIQTRSSQRLENNINENVNKQQHKSTISTLISLPCIPLSFSHINDKNRNCNNNIRTQRMVVVDQNNRKHFLGFKKMNENKYRNNSLVNLFNDRNDYNSCNSVMSNSTKSILSQNTNNKCQISDNSEDDLDIINNDIINNDRKRKRVISESEYEPSDYIQSDVSELKMNLRNRKKNKCDKNVRRSKRLRQQHLDLLTDNEKSESDSDINYDNKDYEFKYKYKYKYKKQKNNRKRSLKQMEDCNDYTNNNINISNRKRVRYNDTKPRKYSSLSQL